MIPARKSAAFTRWFAGDAETRLRRSFGEVRIRGLEELRAASARGPILVVTNHTSWWDPLVALVTGNRWTESDAFAMMDAKNLERLPFFGKVGAFGVRLDDAADGARAIRYAARLLVGPRRLVWIFAQGKEVPITARSLGFRPGSGEIARVANVTVIPGAIRYEMGARAEPTLWLAFGAPIAPDRDVVRALATHERGVAAELERIDRAIVERVDQGFETIHEKREGLFLALATRILSWLTRPRSSRALG